MLDDFSCNSVQNVNHMIQAVPLLHFGDMVLSIPVKMMTSGVNYLYPGVVSSMSV